MSTYSSTGTLEHPVHRDHIDTNELRVPSNGLDGDLSNVRDELHAKPSRLDAPGTAAHVQPNHPVLFGMERLMHQQRELRRVSDGRPLPAHSERVQERGVAFDLDQIKARYGAHHGLEQTSRDLLRVGKTQSVEPHVVRVATNVGDHQQRLIDHREDSRSRREPTKTVP
jgi:hypothetical protein